MSRKKVFTIINGNEEGEDQLLESYTGLVDAPKSLAPDSLNSWQKVDRRGWEDEYENGQATAQHYVDGLSD